MNLTIMRADGTFTIYFVSLYPHYLGRGGGGGGGGKATMIRLGGGGVNSERKNHFLIKINPFSRIFYIHMNNIQALSKGQKISERKMIILS